MSMVSSYKIFFSLAPLNNLKKYLARSIILFFCLVFTINSEAQFKNPNLSGQDNYQKNESINYGEPFMQGEHLFHAGEFLAAKAFFHKYLEENEGHSYSQAHKEFNRAFHKQRESQKKMMEIFQSVSMDGEMTEGCLDKMIENKKVNECDEIVVNESPRL